MWGSPPLVIPDYVKGARWGARAILSRGVIDIPPDRRGFADDRRDLFLTRFWRDTYRDLRVWAETQYGDSREIFAADDSCSGVGEPEDGYHIRATCSGSHGYLYCVAYADMAVVRPDTERVLALVEADDSGGICVGCGAEAAGVEPDARRYLCEACGRRRVYGVDELSLVCFGETEG